ncbi:NADP-dependent oxidoreductase domain-containing protein [Protomyces lactucae-debilis]|uniref:NADP-dependent oxidoreductase domain-containing protein n=1 Tax=Protomyces lactucae-debilis TaxID=2754530 RepID=A0A1Y2F7I7_PROLT|nr:NADP-dependent oxidoreductase domain-containing protein [Protomyces lactucae-debilis]ORY79831.1 NADP-dependent oxidoreductase domain-containing protein [Protomyces lactucae-debilis]
MASLKTALKHAQKPSTTIPTVAFGTYKVTDKNSTAGVIRSALACGYRHFDSAQFYHNEELIASSIAAGIKQLGIERSEVYYTTKIWPDDHTPASQLNQAIQTSIDRATPSLGYIDLILCHWPHKDAEVRKSSWQVLSELVTAKGSKVRDVGVSNYSIDQIKELQDVEGAVQPVLNQIEVHPWSYKKQKALIEWCLEQQIAVEAWAPLGQGNSDVALSEIAKRLNKDEKAVLVKWSVLKGLIPLPKSTNEGRMKSNIELDFDLSDADVATLDGLSK